MATPYLTSDDIIEAVKRAISFPSSQQTFTDEDILYFANQEMFISQVPSVLQYHQEYFVAYVDVPLIANKIRYTIPDRAIGMKIRDLFYLDTNNNLYEMTRINPEDKAWFQRDFNATGSNSYAYYLEGNEIVLPSTNMPNPVGNFRISFFIRPNQLVADENAAVIQAFCQEVTIDNASLADGDHLTLSKLPTAGNNVETVVYTAITGSPVDNEFLIGIDSAATAQNLVNLINNGDFATATLNSAVVEISFDVVGVTVVSADTNNDPTLGLVVSDNVCVEVDKVADSLTNGIDIDFLQTKPGHRILAFDKPIPTNGISGLMIQFDPDDVPHNLIVGDYICAANTAIIPYLPPDLHNVLAERTAARVLAALGDTEGLGMISAKIQEMQQNQGMLLDNRVEGKVQKVSNKHSMLRYGKRMIIRRF